MKFITLSMLLMISLSCFSQANITAEDLKVLIGNWEGSLTYLDYQSNEPYTMPAKLNVVQGKSEDILLISNIYPNEPKANSSEKIKIAKNGSLLNKNTVTSREDLGNGHIQIQTEHKSKDNNKKALIRYTYTIGIDSFSIKKEVQLEGKSTWMKRNEYSYAREK